MYMRKESTVCRLRSTANYAVNLSVIAPVLSMIVSFMFNIISIFVKNYQCILRTNLYYGNNKLFFSRIIFHILSGCLFQFLYSLFFFN